MVKVNPTILKWARETAGLTIEQACRKLGFKDTVNITAVEKLTKMEMGEIEPSRSILVKMSSHYHRPLIAFYLSEVPSKGDRGKDFRTLPGEYSNQTIGIVDSLLRNIQARQSIIRSALEEDEEIQPLPFVKSKKIQDGVFALVEAIRDALKFDINVFRRQNSSQDAFGYLRSCVESAGVFVLLISDLGSHHTRINVDIFRGFALADDIAPFIVINEQDAKAAWSFTLMHELTHIFLGQTGISNVYFDMKIERFCNDVASELLLPEADFNFTVKQTYDFEELVKKISDYAEKRNVSSSLIAYKLLQKGNITKELWRNLSKYYFDLWNKSKDYQRMKSRERKGGPDYFVIRRYMVGRNLISTVKRMMQAGVITTTKAGKVLGVKPKNVQFMMEVNATPRMNHLR